TVVVGGLEVKTDSTESTQVPILGDIPILGGLFASRTNSHTRERFFVFLRTSVMRSATFDDLRFVSAQEKSAAGLEDDCPRLEPRLTRSSGWRRAWHCCRRRLGAAGPPPLPPTRRRASGRGARSRRSV